MRPPLFCLSGVFCPRAGLEFQGDLFSGKEAPLNPRKAQGRGDFDFPPPLTHPLETTKEGQLRLPLFGNLPKLFSFRKDSLRIALRSNAPGTRDRDVIRQSRTTVPAAAKPLPVFGPYFATARRARGWARTWARPYCSIYSIISSTRQWRIRQNSSMLSVERGFPFLIRVNRLLLMLC